MRKQLSWQQGLIILGVIWLLGSISDRLWYALDNSIPAWDQADYLNGVVNYWSALQDPQWLDGSWWRSFWLLSNKIPPLNYILTAPLFNLGGISEDTATLIMLFYSAVLLVSVYGLGIVLFDVATGLWAAGLCQLLPGLYYHRLEFILDFPLTTAVLFSFWLLTLYLFRDKKTLNSISPSPTHGGKPFVPVTSWLLAIFWGISWGLAMLMKQTALFFLLLPTVAVTAHFLSKRRWLKLFQVITALIAGILVAFPWYRTNWLLILTSGKRATVDSAIAEGDPALNTLDAWTYYLKVLPYLLSWHLLLIPVVGLLIYLLRKYLFQRTYKSNSVYEYSQAWLWLGIYLLGGYLLSSLNINKDARYVLPLLPVLAIPLAVGLLSYRSRWQKLLLTITAGLGLGLMWLNIFPLGGQAIAPTLSPGTQRYPYQGQPLPHAEVIAEIVRTAPYLRTVLGVLPSTPRINQHNFSFYGKQNQALVSGRQVGVREEEILRDSRSLDWFLTKTGDQGSIPESQPAMVQLIETGQDFKLHQSWQLPDDSQLKLYHRRFPTVEVTPVSTGEFSLAVELPESSTPGVPIPVTYHWTGDRSWLESGIVLLTWQHATNADAFWLHDHAIAMGGLNFPEDPTQSTFQVTERTAMQTKANISPGEYYLQATYLNRDTGKVYPLDIPLSKIAIAPDAVATPAPELDLVTQLRHTAPQMAEGISGLEPIFAQTARINQYDARQDYLQQAELALTYRLQHQSARPQQPAWLYTVALAQVLQQNVDGAIASFQKITQLDPHNPYGYAYLAFVHLYDWQPQAAATALNTASLIDPNIPEIKILQGAAAVMQGKFIQGWRLLSNS